MNKLMKFFVLLNIPRILPAWVIYRIKRIRRAEVKNLDDDIKKWEGVRFLPFFSLFVYFTEFRNIFYHRIGSIQYFIKWLAPPSSTLFIHCAYGSIGKGFKIQHGFATTINAHRIGENCRVFQQVTIGYKGTGKPRIGNNVTVCCGAKVLGDITVGNNVVIGANAVVCKDVPDNCVVGGVPAKIIKHLG